MDSVILFIPNISFSKTLIPNPNALYRNFSRSLPYQTLTKSTVRSSIRRISSHHSRESFSTSLSAIRLHNLAPSAPIPRQPTSTSNSPRAFASGGGGDGISGGTDSKSSADEIVLDITGMMCEGCVSSVTRILESQLTMLNMRLSKIPKWLADTATSLQWIFFSELDLPQVSSAKVNLATETAVVCVTPEAQLTQNWQQLLGERLANHLSNCGFKSNLRG